MTTDLQNLQAQLRELNTRLADVKKDEKQAYLAAVQERVALYGITEDELLRAAGFRKSRKQRAPAKYYDSSTGKTWSGHGPRPKWLEGKNLDDYLIDRAGKPWWPGEEVVLAGTRSDR
ncbi:histone [Burkholderia ubonensis]|nr:H-NS histone family protein [Burkholderia ubonensis]KVV25467.1 histone [Burkholderia ubonensis]